MDTIEEAPDVDSSHLPPDRSLDKSGPRHVLVQIKKARNLFRSSNPYLLWKCGHQEGIFDPLEMCTTENDADSNTSQISQDHSLGASNASGNYSSSFGSSLPIPIKNRPHMGPLRDFTWNVTVLVDLLEDEAFGDVFIFDRGTDGGFRGYARLHFDSANTQNRRIRLGPPLGRPLDHITGELLVRIRTINNTKFGKARDLDFSDFKMSHVIAQGEKMGTIYRVQGKHTGRLYAVKVIEGLENIQRLVLRPKRVNSPFVVSPTFAIHSKLSASLYVFLDYVSGGKVSSNLDCELENFPRAIQYTTEILSALEDLHHCGVYDFRLHPRKVLLDSLGFVAVVDFGLSDVDLEGMHDPTYSAPENIASGNSTLIGNFWTLGVMLFEMYFGIHPFHDVDPVQTVQNILKAEVSFPDAAKIWVFVDPAHLSVVDLCTKLLSRDPAHRLGAKGGVQSVRSHDVFRHINWDNLRRRHYTPLYRPTVIFRSEAPTIEDHRENDTNIDELLDDLDDNSGMSDGIQRLNPTKNDSSDNQDSQSSAPFPISSSIVSSKGSTSAYATPLSRLGSFNTPTSNEISSKYVTPLSQNPSLVRGSRGRKMALINQAMSRNGIQTNSESQFIRLLHDKGLILPLQEQLDWSGSGQHVEYDMNEHIPLKPLTAIGHGGSALVDSVLCRRIKLARKTMTCNRRQRLETLINEVEHLQRLRHTHIVQLVGTYLQGKKFAILLYPVAEGNLSTFYEMCSTENTSDGVLAYDNCANALLGFFQCLASALAYLHTNITKHLDMKPQNVLVRWPTRSNENFQLYLADFGISKHFQSGEHSQTNSLLARSRKYCSPEVYDSEVRGRAADIFSLGCIYLEMTTVLCGISLDSFADHRMCPNGDDSFHASLTLVEDWIQMLETKHPSLASSLSYPAQDENVGSKDKLWIFREMISYNPRSRPLAADVLASLGGPRECCMQEREGYVSAREEG